MTCGGGERRWRKRKRKGRERKREMRKHLRMNGFVSEMFIPACMSLFHAMLWTTKTERDRVLGFALCV